MANKPIKIKWNHIKYGITVKESRKTEKRKQRTDRWDKQKSNGHMTNLNLPTLIIT